MAQTVKRLSTMRETRVWALGWEDPLEKEMAIHSSTIAWKIPWTEDTGRLQSMESQRVRHDWVTSHSFTFIHLLSLPATENWSRKKCARFSVWGKNVCMFYRHPKLNVCWKGQTELFPVPSPSWTPQIICQIQFISTLQCTSQLSFFPFSLASL